MAWPVPLVPDPACTPSSSSPFNTVTDSLWLALQMIGRADPEILQGVGLSLRVSLAACAVGALALPSVVVDPPVAASFTARLPDDAAAFLRCERPWA